MKTTFINNVDKLDKNLYRIRPNLVKVLELANLLIEETNGECKDWLEIEVSTITYLVDVKLLKETGEQTITSTYKLN